MAKTWTAGSGVHRKIPSGTGPSQSWELDLGTCSRTEEQCGCIGAVEQSRRTMAQEHPAFLHLSGFEPRATTPHPM